MASILIVWLMAILTANTFLLVSTDTNCTQQFFIPSEYCTEHNDFKEKIKTVMDDKMKEHMKYILDQVRENSLGSTYLVNAIVPQFNTIPESIAELKNSIPEISIECVDAIDHCNSCFSKAFMLTKQHANRALIFLPIQCQESDYVEAAKKNVFVQVESTFNYKQYMTDNRPDTVNQNLQVKDLPFFSKIQAPSTKQRIVLNRLNLSGKQAIEHITEKYRADICKEIQQDTIDHELVSTSDDFESSPKYSQSKMDKVITQLTSMMLADKLNAESMYHFKFDDPDEYFRIRFVHEVQRAMNEEVELYMTMLDTTLHISSNEECPAMIKEWNSAKAQVEGVFAKYGVFVRVNCDVIYKNETRKLLYVKTVHHCKKEFEERIGWLLARQSMGHIGNEVQAIQSELDSELRNTRNGTIENRASHQNDKLSAIFRNFRNTILDKQKVRPEEWSQLCTRSSETSIIELIVEKFEDLVLEHLPLPGSHRGNASDNEHASHRREVIHKMRTAVDNIKVHQDELTSDCDKTIKKAEHQVIVAANDIFKLLNLPVLPVPSLT